MVCARSRNRTPRRFRATAQRPWCRLQSTTTGATARRSSSDRMRIQCISGVLTPMANARIEERLKRLPARPGCYIFKDKDGNVLYVGKAASLRSRVPSYFRSSRDLSPKIRTMVTQVDDFEYLTVGSEIEALITENQLVKNYKPK